MKHVEFITKFIIRIIAIAIMVLGLWFVYQLISRILGESYLFFSPYFIICGIIFLLMTGIHLFRFDDIGRKILMGLLWLFTLPFFIFIIVLFINLIAPPFGQISLRGIDLYSDSLSESFISNILIPSILNALLVFVIVFLNLSKTKELFQLKTTRLDKPKTPISIIQFILTLVYKTLIGGLVGGATFLGLGWIKMGVGYYRIFIDFYNYGASLGSYLGWLSPIPIFLLFGVYNAFFLGGDLLLISVLLGGVLAFLINLRNLLFEHYSNDTAAKTLRGFATGLSIITAFGIISVINTRVQIRGVYAEFCINLRSEDYVSASEYISPKFRESHPIGKGVKRVLEFKIECSEEEGKTLFVSSFGKNATIFPEDSFFSLIDDYGGHTAITMEKVNGKWYLTGRGPYLFEWVFD